MGFCEFFVFSMFLMQGLYRDANKGNRGKRGCMENIGEGRREKERENNEWWFVGIFFI